MSDYKWRPIAPISDLDRRIDLSSITSIYETWRISKERITKSSPANFKYFNDKLVRRLSIETGILERLYDLDRGTTEALVENGFLEDLVSHSDTDIEPSRLIDFLRDQEAAVQLVIDCVAGNRDLTIGIIHELHAVLTQNQNTTSAVDQFGNRLEIPLLKGEFKEQPNNPKRPDGSTHEYCPPIQVKSEMENLLAWLNEYRNEDPVLVSSWFHHRFTQIHPYQDGNGRVVRALTTLLLLRSDLLPLVIERDLRSDYIDALETADNGDLTLLASLIARLEQSAILQALSIDVDAQIENEQRLTSAVIATLAAKFDRRKQEKFGELRKVNGLAVQLRARTRNLTENAFSELKDSLEGVAESDIHMTEGGPDRDNAHWYKYEVIQTAREADKYVNFDEDHYFIKSSIRIEHERLVFVTSIHHVGRELSGIMEVTAFAQLESYEGSDDRAIVSQNFFQCNLEPFVITYKTEESDIEASFERWFDAAAAIAIKEYGDKL